MSKLLMVEDDMMIKIILERLIKNRYDSQLTHVDAAEKALPYLPVDLVLSDIEQPNSEGGIWLKDYVRKNHPNTPIILMSGNHDYKNQLKDGTIFIPKPFTDFETVYKTLDQFLKKK